MVAIGVWMWYTLSIIKKEFDSRSNENHVQRPMYIPGNRRSSERSHWHAHQDRVFDRYKRLYTGSKNEVGCSINNNTSVNGEINWKKKPLTDWVKIWFVFSEADGNILLLLPFFKNCLSPRASSSQSSISVSSTSASIWAEVSLLAWDQSKAAGCAKSGLSESASVWKELGKFEVFTLPLWFLQESGHSGGFRWIPPE